MNKFAMGCGVLLAILLFIVVIAALALGGSYNRLVRSQQTVDQSWAQVQNVYQRRADLIPNLVNTVSGAANFEKSTLTEVTNARASVGRVQLDPNKAPTDAAQLEKFQAAQGELSNAVSRRDHSSLRNQARKNRHRCSLILARQLLRHLLRRPRRKANAHGREHSGERTPLACWFRRSAETIFHWAGMFDG